MFDWTWKHTVALIIALVILGGFVVTADANTPDTGLSYVCGSTFRIDAAETGEYTIVAYYTWENNHLPPTITWAVLQAGESRNFSIGADHDYVHVFYEDTFIGDVEVSGSDCADGQSSLPPDDRENWQMGDSFFYVAVDSYGWLSVYATGSGEGVLILHTQEPACSADGTACFDGSGVTLTDPEGKVYYVQVTL